MSTKNKKDIIVGSMDLDPDELAAQNIKVRITTMVDEEALEDFKKIAEKSGVKYQTLLNKVIRGFVDQSKGKAIRGNLTEENVRQIVRDELKRKKRA